MFLAPQLLRSSDPFKNAAFDIKVAVHSANAEFANAAARNAESMDIGSLWLAQKYFSPAAFKLIVIANYLKTRPENAFSVSPNKMDKTVAPQLEEIKQSLRKARENLGDSNPKLSGLFTKLSDLAQSLASHTIEADMNRVILPYDITAMGLD